MSPSRWCPRYSFVESRLQVADDIQVRLFAVDSFSVRRLSASIPSTYICTLLQLTKNAAPNELVGHIAIEQTPYFDLSNDHELECILAALLEDEFRRAKQPELEPYLVSDWF